MTHYWKWLAVPSAVLAAIVASAPVASAQRADVRYDPISKTVNLDLDSADVRQVVRQMLSQAGVGRWQMEPGIDAKVTLSLRNSPFDRALQTVLARAGAEFDYDNGRMRIYRVAKSPDSGYDSDERRSRRGDVPRAFWQHVGLKADNQALATIFGSLNRQTGVRFSTTQQVPGDIRITAVAGDEPLWIVLQRIAHAAKLKVDIVGDHEAVFSPLTSVRASDRNGPIGAPTCRNCRYELKREWKFCPMCGERIH